MNKFSKYMTNFFTNYLKQEKGCSNNTILAYRDTFKLFLKFLKNKKINIKNFDIEDFTKDLVIEFLDEVELKSSIVTRNIRKAAINSFCNYVLYEEPTSLENINSILSISPKKATHKLVEYLSDSDMKLLLEQPDINKQKEKNDLILLSVLYDTGARVSEFLNIKLKDVSLQKPYSIKVLGKGNKHREIPILEKTANLLKKYIDENNIIQSEQYLFCNSRGEKYSRKGISHKIDKYSNRAKTKSQTFPDKVHPHMFRHTKAVSMLNSGIDILIISNFLGHSSIETTMVYAKITDENKRKILEKAYFDTESKELPDWIKNNDIMEFLESL